MIYNHALGKAWNFVFTGRRVAAGCFTKNAIDQSEDYSAEAHISQVVQKVLQKDGIERPQFLSLLSVSPSASAL